MARNKGMTCNDHWMATLADKFMIIHQFGGSLCNSETFNDVTNVYDRKGVRTGTPVETPNFLTVGPIRT